MKYIEPTAQDDLPVLELSQRNLEALLLKLRVEGSARTLIDPDGKIAVKAVPDEEHYASRPPGEVVTFGMGYSRADLSEAWGKGHYAGYAQAVYEDGGDIPDGVDFTDPYAENKETQP